MDNNNRRIAKNAVFLYLRMFLTMAVSLYTVRVVIKTLSVTDYGIYGAVGGVILTFSFITGVLTNASQRFFSVELGNGKDGRVNEVFSTLFLTYLGVSLLVIILAETVGIWFLETQMTIPEGRENAAMWVYQFALLSFVSTLLTNPYQALVIAQEKMNLYAYLSILDVTFKLIIVYALLMFDYDKLKVYAVLVFVSQLVINSMYILYCKVNYQEIKLVWKVDKPMIKTVFSYSSWTLFGTIAGMFNTQGLNILLNVFFGPIANAAYSVASQVYHTVGSFATNFYTAVKPPLIKNYASGNYDYVQKLFLFSSKSLFVLLFIVVLPLMVCTEAVLNIWLGQIGDYMIPFVKLSLIYITVLIISYPITAVVQAGGFVKVYHTLVDGFTFLSLPIVYILFKLHFDAVWAYIVSILVFVIAHILRIYVLKRVFPVFAIRPYVIQFLLPSIMLFVVLYMMLNRMATLFAPSLLNTLLICGLCCLLALLSGMFFVLTKAERKSIVNLLKNNKK